MATTKASQIPVPIRTRSPSPSRSPAIKSPSGHADSIFFQSNNKTPRSPSPSRRNEILIKIDPAEDEPAIRDSDIFANSKKTQSRFMLRSYEYDKELVRRQQVLIALQPLTPSEKIEEKRRLLEIKIGNRKRDDEIMSRASTSLGMVNMKGNQSMSRRSPSPTPSISMSKVKNAKTKKENYQVIKHLAESTTQAAKVTKKIISSPTKSVKTINKTIITKPVSK